MRAMVLTAAGRALEFREVAQPRCGTGQVLLRVEACGICLTDLHVLDAELPNIRYPVIPGHEIVGRVDRLGASVTTHRIGDRVGITRYGAATVPMDEARASCALDISGRPFTLFLADLPPGSTGGFEHELTEEFFRALANAAKLTLHLEVQAGTNAHHGSGDCFVAEADESDGSLLEYTPNVAVVTNIETDHLDFYGSADAYVKVFDSFVERLAPGGALVVCTDDRGAAALAQRTAEL